MRPVELAAASLDPTESDSEQNLRRQIEETLRPMYKEAQEYEATNERLADQVDIMGKIQEIANALYFVKQQLAIMQASQERVSPKANLSVPSVNRNMYTNQSDGSSRISRTPPSPLTPPHTPHSSKEYIGPILTDDDEEDLFDDVTLAIRTQKIIEFHEAAAVIDIGVAEQLHQHYKAKGDKRKIGQMLKRRQEEAEELQMKKEKERKEATEVERKRRRAEIVARAQNRESEQYDLYHKHTKPTPRSGSKARNDQNRSKHSSDWSQDRTGHAVDTRMDISATKRGQVMNGISEGRPPGVMNRNRPENSAGSHGLFSMDPVNHQTKGWGTDGPRFGSRQSSKITPLTPTVGLPEIDSDDDEGDDESVGSSLGDDESLAPDPVVYDHKHVRFTPSVLAENSTESSERGSTFSNTLGLRPDSDVGGVYRAMPSGLGNSKGAVGSGMTRPLKPVGMGLEEGKEEKRREIWYPTENFNGRR